MEHRTEGLPARMRAAFSNARGLLSSRAYRLYLIAQVGSYAGTSIATVGLAFAALELGGSIALSVVLACAAIPRVVFLLLGGAFADRYDKRTILVSGNLLSGLAQLSAAALVLTHTAATWQIAALAAIGGVSAAWIQPAMQAVVRHVVEPGDRQAAVAFQRLLQNSFKIAGPAAGGLLVALVNPGWALLIDGISFLVAAAVLTRLPKILGGRPSTGVVAELREGWLDFWSRRWLVLLIAQGSLALLFWLVGIQLLGPIYAAAELGGADAWGIVLACFAAGLVGGSLVAAAVQPRLVGVTSSVGVIGLALPLVAMAAGWPLVLLCVSAVLAGVLLDLSVVTQSGLMLRAIPKEVFGRVIAFSMVGELGLVPLGYLIFGPLALHLGMRDALWICAVSIIFCAVLPLASKAVLRLDANAGEPETEEKPAVPSSAG